MAASSRGSVSGPAGAGLWRPRLLAREDVDGQGCGACSVGLLRLRRSFRPALQAGCPPVASDRRCHGLPAPFLPSPGSQVRQAACSCRPPACGAGSTAALPWSSPQRPLAPGRRQRAQTARGRACQPMQQRIRPSGPSTRCAPPGPPQAAPLARVCSSTRPGPQPAATAQSRRV